ncbi:neuroligin-4, X-linked [Lingula anatina]|uniref:Carboxylic ester hydrolase n=1 Tax=Lingula anatina TaxID=7574 RepID=A0A1S3HEQ3_LINAN|nr:neuroligin-4, X-linked [Lingula anatina]|eukprot:XP_013383514.1 neuroligin-4, X-linked [Lingula anatina]
MVWIHGGGYAIGTGSHIHADLLAVTGGTVVVTINYRLNIFGFLATKGSPGNIGLWDQTLALQWVQDNVLEFGGDAKKVTIFGESAGGTSVSQLALSPHTKGLFHRVISESGVLYSPWAWSHQQDELVAAVAKYLHCPRDSHMVDCFRQHSALTIFVAATNARNEVVKNMMGIPFAPVVDGDFFPESPMVTLQQKSSESYLRFISLDYMAGTMNAEGGLVILALTSPNLPFNVSLGVPTSYVVKHAIPDEVTYFYDSSNRDKIQDAIIKVYAADPKVDIVTQGRKLVDMYGDMMFVAPTLQLLREHANSTAPLHGTTYQFYFTHVPSHHMIPTMPWIKGANHVDELPYVFGAKTMYPSGTNLTPEEQKLSLEIMRYWSNFAKTGNPNNGTGVTWPEFQTSNQSYIELGDAVQAKVNILPQRMRLWLEEIPNLLG